MSAVYINATKAVYDVGFYLCNPRQRIITIE